MAITLTYDTTTIDLHPDLYWSDELDWAPVEQSVQRSVSGALIVMASERIAGRPITLQPEDDASAWMQRATVATLVSWGAVPERQMTLTINGTSYDVIFRHQDGAAIEARPVVQYQDPQPTDFYTVTLRFMEV